jgi:BASS family bile acid:Na+ symporter
MTAIQIIGLVVSISIILTVFAFGLDANLGDAIWLFRKPGLLAKSIFSMNVLMVIFVIVVAKLFNLDPAVKVAILALAISPVPPLLPKKRSKVGAANSYAIALVVTAALFSLVLIPGWLELLGGIFHVEVKLATGKILSVVFLKILLPLFAGILIHRFAPHLAARTVKPISLIAVVLLVGAVLPVLFMSFHAMWAMIGNGVLVMVFLFSVVGILAGHLLGGPNPDDRSILALATSVRHPGISLAIATLNFPERSKAILIVVLFHLIVGAIIAIPYIKWRKKVHLSLDA